MFQPDLRVLTDPSVIGPILLLILPLVAGALALDWLVRPRPLRRFGLPWRSAKGAVLLALVSTALYGGFLALCGNAGLSALLAFALLALLALASNAKRAMLGEPLLFSDLALMGAIFRHPQFYLSALSGWQKLAMAAVAALLALALAWLFVADPVPHGIGAGLALVGVAALTSILRLPGFRALAPRPDPDADMTRLGLVPTLILHWRRWREMPDAPPCPPVQRSAIAPGLAPPELIVAIQCESFADPVELFGDPAMALPGLTAARADAWHWGNLLVSGFGAYTMRTEYALLFGREESDLGFRRFDPFLTALRDSSYALPIRLRPAGWRSLFIHPHDMRFYGRDRILPASGFDRLVGEESFAPPAKGEGRYVTDAAIAHEILTRAAEATDPTLLYAVTIENHGPWSADKDAAAQGSDSRSPGLLVEKYRRLVGKGDTMLAELRAGIAALQRPALLVFFGDHRPSIPGASEPGGNRHTPYVVLRFDARGQLVKGDGQPRDLTPAALHHLILDNALGAVVSVAD